MFKQKKALFSLAIVTALAACGGGGGNTSAPPIDLAGGGSDNPAAQPIVVVPTTDTKLAGAAVLVSQQVLFGNRDAIDPINTIDRRAYSEFTSNVPRVGDPVNAGYGTYGVAKGINVPLQSFGYRISFDQTVPGTVHSQPGRLAFELQDQSIVTGQEIVRIEIDKITASVDSADVLTLTVAPDAKVYVYAKNSAGQSATVSAPALPALIKQTVNPDDPSSIDVLFDVDAAVGAALSAATGPDLAVLGSVKDFVGGGITEPMEVAMTFSNLDMVLDFGATEKLLGKTITVDGSGLPGVMGGGAKGYVQIDPPSSPPI